MLDNKKLMKELASIYASSNKAKNSIVSELAKIDEKYKRLAEQEKTKLNEMLKNIEVQLGYYRTLLDLNNASTGEVTDAILVDEPKEEPKEEEEPVVQDTIFPENNEPEEKEAETVENDSFSAETTEEVETVSPVVEEKNEDAVIEDIPAVGDADWGSIGDGQKLDKNGWPQW